VYTQTIVKESRSSSDNARSSGTLPDPKPQFVFQDCEIFAIRWTSVLAFTFQGMFKWMFQGKFQAHDSDQYGYLIASWPESRRLLSFYG
jgi:hypothetical protein